MLPLSKPLVVGTALALTGLARRDAQPRRRPGRDGRRLGGDYAPKSLFSVSGTTLQGMPTYSYNAAAEQVDATPPFTFTAK
ncbi:MAG: hypothetical protein QOJ79_2438 [Actinomycetota bacterium]|nr:hypothetical protein [Actinomycetota bacterium]